MGGAASLAPYPRQYGGRPRLPDLHCADAIFYVLRTGCQWQALDQTELRAHSTAHARFQEWMELAKLYFLRMAQMNTLCRDVPALRFSHDREW